MINEQELGDMATKYQEVTGLPREAFLAGAKAVGKPRKLDYRQVSPTRYEVYEVGSPALFKHSCATEVAAAEYCAGWNDRDGA